MMRRNLARLARMDRAEIAWRTRAGARAGIDRVRTRLAPPRWNRGDLVRALAPLPELVPAREALSARQWDDAHRALAQHFSSAPQRFVVSPSSKHDLVSRIRVEFPDGARIAAARADRILAGEYDLLGYRGLRFLRDLHPPDPPDLPGLPGLPGPPDLPDWHVDPVSGRRPPAVFWADVPYLDAACGDHKVIWELNRHQHWIALGRAYWLTGQEKYRDRFVAELASWLSANPPLLGVNWASMLELALRSLSWVWAINLFVEDEGPAKAGRHVRGPAEAGRHARGPAEAGRHVRHAWLVDLLIALDRQLAHVEQNLSRYFSPNTHLLGEALALYVAGRALPELAASGRRASIGRRILLDEIDRQIATDGGHAERSTHYQRYTLDFYLLALGVARLTGDEAAATFEDAAGRLASAARLLADDRGRLPHIGDDDGGALLPIASRAGDDIRDSLALAAALTGRADLQIGSAPEEVLWTACSVIRQSPIPNRQSPSLTSAALPETGYYVSRSAAHHAVIDGGPHGYQNGGHAHADALSMTLTVRGYPLLIDPGTACYTIDPALRDRMRSTALHNTVTVDERSQSTPRGPFHWSHVANARVGTWRTNDAFDFFDGAHDGYAPIEHRRRVLALHGDLVIVADLLSGEGTHTAAAHWHCDPRWAIDTRGRSVVFTRSGERVGLTVPQGLVERFSADAETGLGWYSPAYGRLDHTSTIRVSHTGAAPFWLVSVFDLDPENPVADVDWMPVWAEAGAVAHATAIRIARATSIDYALFAEPDHARLTGELAEPAERRSLSAISALSAVKRGRWRVGELETDARMLFCRLADDGRLTRVAIVDGSLVRSGGRRGVHVALPGVVPDLHLEYRDLHVWHSGIR